MKKMIQRTWGNEKGFTLIELIIVIAILAIIAAVAIPNILKAVDNSRKTSDVVNAKVIADAATQVLAKIEAANGAEYVAATALNVSTIDGSSANADATLAAFEDALFSEFNNGAPVPVYQGEDSINADGYYLVIDDGVVEVHVGDSVDTTSADDLELYPDTDPLYDNE